MKFDVTKAADVLERTPRALHALLYNIPEDLALNNEGENTWSPFDVVSHLIVCERTNFMSRAQIILSDKEDRVFAPMDMTAHFEYSQGKSMNDLLEAFAAERTANIVKLQEYHIGEMELDMKGIHPKFGAVRLSEVLSTWVAHDLIHIAQITRVMAKQYKESTGPFIEFLRILQ